MFPEFARDSLLGRLPVSTQSELLKLGISRQCQNGEKLFSQGEGETHVVLLVNARAKITLTTEDGRNILLAIRHGGDIVGEISSLDDRPRPTTATIIGESGVRIIQQPDFCAFLTMHPNAMMALGQCVANKLRGNIQRWSTMSGLPVRVRLARALAECVGDGYRPRQDSPPRVPLTQEELASYVGSSPVSVHRNLAYFRDKGIISTGYRHIMIHDVERLRCEHPPPTLADV
jgi:CRP-like cAMP-binding protein